MRSFEERERTIFLISWAVLMIPYNSLVVRGVVSLNHFDSICNQKFDYDYRMHNKNVRFLNFFKKFAK